MRMANYIDIERTHLDRPLGGLGGGLVARGCSFLFFPEGHRSRNGRLQRFRSGAFWVAAEYGLPIVPICLSGTERITAGRWPLLHPALVTMEALAPVQPSSFPPDNRALLMKREVENVFRKYFGE
jgi:1-acyl-sn-glycerol-3-phosphate acyltransferase